MPLARSQLLAINAVAALVGIAAVVAAARSVLIPAVIAPCSDRYHNMTSFTLERGGTVLTAADLQASLGGRDVGVMESISIAPAKGAPAPIAMTVSLQKASLSVEGVVTEFKGGTTFPWQPRAVQGKSSACLSYNVLLPADFEFHRGGVLPGIAGTDGAEQGDGFVARLAWRQKAGGGVTVRVTENGTTRATMAERQVFDLPRGRWVRVEQEVVMNAPKKADGVLRVWIDGSLALERTDITYRNQNAVSVAGVSVDVFRGSGPDDVQAAAAKNAKVQFTPFELRWQ